jgi:hypothetical protein
MVTVSVALPHVAALICHHLPLEPRYEFKAAGGASTDPSHTSVARIVTGAVLPVGTFAATVSQSIV